jgi:hypothetical protein
MYITGRTYKDKHEDYWEISVRQVVGVVYRNEG